MITPESGISSLMYLLSFELTPRWMRLQQVILTLLKWQDVSFIVMKGRAIIQHWLTDRITQDTIGTY